MFERYTERARRVIFFARYEASQFGSTTIESEHFLLGLIREDKNLVDRFLGGRASVESIRRQVEVRPIREKVSTSVDLPLTDECKRILRNTAQEAELLGHRHFGTEHLLLGILREETCVAAQILYECGLRLDAIREELARPVSEPQAASNVSGPSAASAAVEPQSHTDSLTGLYNRRFFDAILQREASRAERHRLPLTLLVLDLDGFKRINESYGHIVGDEALGSLAKLLQESVRKEDFIFRYGGDEFAIVLPQTGLGGGMQLGEHIRSRVEIAHTAEPIKVAITVSIGVSEYELPGEQRGPTEAEPGRTQAVRMLVQQADQALDKARRDGGNRVEGYRSE